MKGATDPHHQRGDALHQSAPSRPQAPGSYSLGPLPKPTLPVDPAPRTGCHYPFPQDLTPLPRGPRWSGLGALGRRLALAKSASCCSGTDGPNAQALSAGASLGWGSLGSHCQRWQPSRLLLPWDPGVSLWGFRGVKCAVKGIGGTG